MWINLTGKMDTLKSDLDTIDVYEKTIIDTIKKIKEVNKIRLEYLFLKLENGGDLNDEDTQFADSIVSETRSALKQIRNIATKVSKSCKTNCDRIVEPLPRGSSQFTQERQVVGIQNDVPLANKQMNLASFGCSGSDNGDRIQLAYSSILTPQYTSHSHDHCQMNRTRPSPINFKPTKTKIASPVKSLAVTHIASSIPTPDTLNRQAYSSIISHIISPSHFYFQINISALIDLCNQINKWHDHECDNYKLSKPPEIGHVYLAKFSEDKNYYRALVMCEQTNLNNPPAKDHYQRAIVRSREGSKNDHSNKSYEVFFLDYGNTDVVEMCDIFYLPERFSLGYPPFAVKASLCSLSWLPHQYDWSGECMQTFRDMAIGVDDNKVEIHIENVMESYCEVKVMAFVGDCELDVATHLIKENLCIREMPQLQQEKIASNMISPPPPSCFRKNVVVSRKGSRGRGYAKMPLCQVNQVGGLTTISSVDVLPTTKHTSPTNSPRLSPHHYIDTKPEVRESSEQRHGEGGRDRSEYIPSVNNEDTATQCLKMLEEMGFRDRTINRHCLEINNYDADRAIEDIINILASTGDGESNMCAIPPKIPEHQAVKTPMYSNLIPEHSLEYPDSPPRRRRPLQNSVRSSDITLYPEESRVLSASYFAKQKDFPVSIPQKFSRHSDSFNVTVSELITPLEIYCQTSSNEDAQIDMREILSNIGIPKDEVCVTFNNLEPGATYLVRHKDGKFYRGKLLELIEHSTTAVSIHFVDFGNTVNASVRDIYYLNELYWNIIPIAMHMTLFGIKPPSEEGWSADCMNYLADILEPDKNCKIITVKVWDTRQDEDFVSYIVSMYFKGQDIRQCLINKGFAICSDVTGELAEAVKAYRPGM